MALEHLVLCRELHESYGVSKEAFIDLGPDCTLQDIVELITADLEVSQDNAYVGILDIMKSMLLLNVNISEVKLGSRLVSDLCFGMYD